MSGMNTNKWDILWGNYAEIVEAAAKTEGDKSWKTLFREFLGETTFHGLSYIAHDAYFSIRSTCAILFGVLVVKRLVRMLLVRPRSVDVEIYYAGLLYPAVTICNQNYFSGLNSGLDTRLRTKFMLAQLNAVTAILGVRLKTGLTAEYNMLPYGILDLE
ncbi:hypothetical protein CAPTEDRAFT_188165, partial [Capitella teleta]